MNARPVVEFLQRRSGLPSPLKSKVLTISHSGSLRVGKTSSYLPFQVAPVRYQMVACPEEIFLLLPVFYMMVAIVEAVLAVGICERELRFR